MTSIKQILISNRITFIESGPNVANNHVNIHCPWCGSSDPSYHMGINLKTGQWGCWRNPRHRGNKIQSLYKKLGIRDQVEGYQRSTFSSLQSTLRSPTTPIVTREHKDHKELQASITKPHGVALSHLQIYLASRGFTHDEIEYVISTGMVTFQIYGRLAWRVIFPIRDKTGRLRAATGRTSRSSAIKYLTFPSGWTKDCVLGWKWNEKTVVIVEGPFDALRVQLAMPNISVFALLGTTATAAQRSMILSCSLSAKRVIVLLDEEATSQSLTLCSQLAQVGAIHRSVPQGDPGDLPGSVIRSLIY